MGRSFGKTEGRKSSSRTKKKQNNVVVTKETKVLLASNGA
jgi:hypothetical protein